MLIGAAGLIWFEDPVIGDMIAAAVSYGPSSASPTPRDFVEASLPATAHGLAIAPKSDDAVVILEGERVVVSMMASSQNAPAKVAEGAPKVAVNPAFIDFTGWGVGSGKDFLEKRKKLEASAALADPTSLEGSGALTALARFYLGHEMDLEALGVLKVMGQELPGLEQDPEYLGMRGAANYMAHRLTAADEDLSKGPLRGDASAALWRAMVAVERGEWERAGDFFRASGDQIYAYAPAKAASFSIAWAEAAFNANDYDLARRKAQEATSTGDRDAVERGQFILANLKAVIDGPAVAYDEFERLSKQASEPIAVRAELKRLETGVASGRMTANDAAGELELLRFRWRGDDVEMATVGILADQYMRVGHFRDALLLAQSTALRDATAPGSRELRIKLADYFRRLFLTGEADRLDPIQSLALFYEFADQLVPVGADGDQMIRKLAQRLVAFDLLEPASQLLQYQVDNRIRGVGKAAIAVDLATIYLWDKRPDRALAAINSTRQPQLPHGADAGAPPARGGGVPRSWPLRPCRRVGRVAGRRRGKVAAGRCLPPRPQVGRGGARLHRHAAAAEAGDRQGCRCRLPRRHRRAHGQGSCAAGPLASLWRRARGRSQQGQLRSHRLADRHVGRRVVRGGEAPRRRSARRCLLRRR